jgi:hypothetical protein
LNKKIGNILKSIYKNIKEFNELFGQLYTIVHEIKNKNEFNNDLYKIDIKVKEAKESIKRFINVE